MSTKKSGYDILKEKIAKLEKERDELRKDIGLACQKQEELRNEINGWRTQSHLKTEECLSLGELYEKTSSDLDKVIRKRDWLIKHASWFTLIKYKRAFKTGK